MNEIHFNKRALEGLALPSSGDTLYRDSDVSGLAIRVWPSGRRVFVWSRRANGKLEFKTLGEFPAVSINAARAKASEYNAALAKWKQDDFVGDPFRRPAQLTLATLLEDYVAKHLRGHAKRPERAEKALRWSVNRYLSRLLDQGSPPSSTKMWTPCTVTLARNMASELPTKQSRSCARYSILRCGPACLGAKIRSRVWSFIERSSARGSCSPTNCRNSGKLSRAARMWT